ncbi:hypothetical protein FRC11_007166 [Ceratobasidium sp. 423]|nr:hypothetical protein FRC11_007166 [Ceratobasidium sp. 423]
METDSITIKTQMNPASGDGDPGSKSPVSQAPTMVVRSAMNAAISALRSAVGNDKKHKATLNKIRDAFKAVEADDLPRSEIVERGVHLAEIMPESVASLHKTRPRPILAFCAAALSWLFKAKLEPTLGGDEENAKVWEDVIFRGLMQPILSIVDSEGQDLDVVGDVVYRAICGIMRSPWSHGFGGRFAHSLALVLVSTCSSSSNKAMLLDPSILGTDALSKLIIDAKDYHHLDTLLELSFTIFSSQGGKITRKAYADSIFNSGYALERLPDDISNELASIHSVTNGGNSEKHVLDIMRTMSRAGIERQVFMTKDLSYCGTRFTQTPPSNVIVLDHENLCIVFCDKNGESDVLSVATTTIKGVELIPQDAALAARDLAGVLKDDNALTRHSSLASMKISNAVFSVPLKKNRNPSNDQAEEMIRKYVNLPSSRDGSPPPSERVKSTTQTAQPRLPPPGAPVTPATATRQATPLQTEKLRNDSPLVPRLAARPVLQPSAPTPAPDDSASTKPVGSATTRTKRTAAEKSKKAIKLAALVDMDGSELTDIDPENTPEHPGPQTAIKTPADGAPALPTPPRTRARAQAKPAAKTLVPSTPTMEDLPEVSSPPDVPSPSPKPVRKRKLVEDDPFELPPLKPEHPVKRGKTADTSALSSSQHIQPRDTAATRAKARYGTISKRMRASSPVESIHSADNEADSPRKKAPISTERKKRDGAPVKDTAATRMRPRLDKNDEPDVPKRQTRARAANAKSKLVASIDTVNTKQGKDSDLSAVTVPKPKTTETSEPPKDLEAQSPKEVAHQVRNVTFKSVENASVQPAIKPLSASKSKNGTGITRTSTELQIPKDTTNDVARAGASMDTVDAKKPVPIPPRSTSDATNRAPRQQDPKPTPTFVHVGIHASAPQERKPAAPPETPVQLRAERTKERIQPEKTQATAPQAPVRQVETPPAKDARRTNFPRVFISVDSDDEMEPPQEFASYQANVEPIRRPSVLTSRPAPTTQPAVKPQPHSAPAPAKAKHAAVTRVLFDTSTQPSPKSALASPQRRTLANGARPSVSFLEPPVRLSRRGSSGSSTEAAHKQRAYGIDRERLREGHSTRTGDVMLQIADILTEIQETVALNLGEKIQAVNAEAHSARAELTKSVIEELDQMKAECESHHNVLHEFESAFNSQAQAMLDGLGRVAECNSRMDVGIRNILAANARVGQSIAGSTLDFQVPELFGAFLTS